MPRMDAVTLAPLVVVDARALDDLLELARLAAERLGSDDPIALALSGSRAQVLAGAGAEVR